MDSHLNRSEYKSMENTWAKAIEENKKVDVDVKIKYPPESERPDRIIVKYKIEDQYGNIERHTKIFLN